ncbi:hypothetical protein AMS68_005767 [Peltaster fructicola]|uniref:ARM repeat-containing protein n=1 Tax=Peltaster fructicola TaxID=286661 RepID=A0A6H0Y0S0_9PEZI|nr:hypothetical protein AMS68_005767 [Peltaster fructicola]
MATNSQSAEQRELALVGKVEMRIALTDTDAKLEATLKTYLAPLLLKLASDHVSVRNKVISVCQHVNTRVKPDSIQLPVAALVKQFKEQQTPLVRHFDILYIQQGIDRLSSSEKAELLPLIIGGFATAGTHAAQVFNLFLRLLEHFILPLRASKEDLELRTKYEVSEEDASSIARWLGKLVLYTPQRTTCPGLSRDDCAFFSVQDKPDVWSPSNGGLNILRTKILAVRLLASGLFKDSERFLPALYASADSASTVSDLGDDLMKRTLPTIDLEDTAVLDTLFASYFGQGSIPRASPPLRTRTLNLLDGIALPDADGEDVAMTNGMTSRAGPGRQALKLRTAVFEYINFVARYGPQDVLHAIAPQLINRLRDFVENQGWPKPGLNEDLSTRAYAYEVIGLLIKAGAPTLIFETDHPRADLLRWLFTSLASDASGGTTIVSIEEAVSTVLGTLARHTITKEEQQVLEDLLIEQMTLSDDLKANQRLRSTRFAAVRFANRCLPFESVKARWVDLLATDASDERMEVKEESERGLSPYWYLMLKGANGVSGDEVVSFPPFTDLVTHLFPGSSDNTKRHDRNGRHLAKSLAFSRRILLHEALRDSKQVPALSADWERNLDTLVENDQKARDTVKCYLAQFPEGYSRSLKVFQAALFEQLISQTPQEQSYIVQHLSLAPDSLCKALVPAVSELLPVIMSNDYTSRVAAAHCFGILASHPDAGDMTKLTDELLAKALAWKTAAGAQINQVHGSILALAYTFSRKHYRTHGHKLSDSATDFIKELSVEMPEQATDSTIRDALYIALGQLSIFGALSFEKLDTLKATTNEIYKLAKTGDEKAITCLGQLSMTCKDSTDEGLKHIENKLHELHEVRQAEVHFSVGEAFSYLACGWKSSALATKLDVNGPGFEQVDRSGILERLTERFAKDCVNTKPSLKKAAVMWLLCLVQYCGHLPEMQTKLGLCQAAFKRCLVDRDDLVQESASRGLSLVYEKGDRSLKDDLVRDLVSSFSSDKQGQLAGTVSEDTQLFEPGALPTGDGSVSTYKDIMSLASEVGDSSLVYRFMSMASSNAIWSSRAAFGRFGLSNVLSDSSVDGYLAENPKLYPKLYRYRFDPNSGVRRSMNDIWNALVKDSGATIDKHFDAIIQDLLVSILGKEWRVRQASCAAVADLLQGRSLEKYESYLEDVWDKCFKVLDDIKESVRAAAATLARSLTGILTRSLESDHSANKTATAMLKHVLPFLLSPSGMESSAQEVQLFAVHTLLEIIKKSNGQTLRPFIPELIERLLGLLSTMEPEAVNYIHLNASKYNLTEQKIDDMRLSSVRSSPIMEAIERCLDLLDDDTMQKLQPKLEHAMRSAVGLPSKVGASRVLVSLSTRRAQIFRPSADHFLRVTEKLVLDRNETVASSYAAAAGYMARHASDKQFLRLATFASDLYFKAEGDREGATPRRSISSGEVVHAIAKHASDRFNAVATSFLPLVYFAKHDSHPAVKEQFQNTWNEAVGGARAVQLYLRDILMLIQAHLDSPQWTLKHTAARSVADATIAISTSDRTLFPDTAVALWPVIEKALAGKTWDGKEVVLEAFVQFVEHARSFYENKSDVASAIAKIAVREAKRNNPAYRQHAIRALAKTAAARDDIDMSTTVREIISPLIEELQGGDPMDMDTDADDSSRSKPSEVRELTVAAAVECLFMSVAPKQPKMGQAMHAALVEAVKVKQPSAAVRKSIYQSIGKLFERIRKDGGAPMVDAAGSGTMLMQLLFGHDAGSEALRLQRAEAVLQICQSVPALGESLKAEVAEEVRGEKSTVLQNLNPLFSLDLVQLQQDAGPAEDEKSNAMNYTLAVEACDWDHRWNFTDVTASTQTRHVHILTHGNAVWDPSVRPHGVGSESPLPSDDLPPFNVLTNDQDRERLARSTTPGTFSVIVTPDSFANLPEYVQEPSPTERRRSSTRSLRGAFGDSPSTSRRASRVDPNIVILDRFEENYESPSLYTSPPRRASLPDCNNQQSLPLVIRSVTYPPTSNSDHGNIQLLASFKRHTAYRIIPQAFDSPGTHGETPRSLRDMFETEAVQFHPLQHAIRALSALNLYHLGQARLEDAAHHYHEALFQANDEDISSEGSLLRHFLLFLYDISITWIGESEEANMWAMNLGALQSIITERARLNTTEKYPYIVWLICILDMNASLLGNGECSFFREVIRLQKLPNTAHHFPRSYDDPTTQATAGDILSDVLELNQAIVIQTAKIAHAAHGFRLEYAAHGSNNAALLDHLQAQVTALETKLIEFWTVFCPNSLEPVSAATCTSLPPRVRAVFEHALVLYHSVIIYTRTSMYPGQRVYQARNQIALTADTEWRVDIILSVANQMVIEHTFDQRFIVFPIFMAGYVTKQSDLKVLAMDLLNAFEGSGIEKNTATTRKLLRAVCEEQSHSIGAGRHAEEVDWMRVSIDRGLRIINCGL